MFFLIILTKCSVINAFFVVVQIYQFQKPTMISHCIQERDTSTKIATNQWTLLQDTTCHRTLNMIHKVGVLKAIFFAFIWSSFFFFQSFVRLFYSSFNLILRKPLKLHKWKGAIFVRKPKVKPNRDKNVSNQRPFR